MERNKGIRYAGAKGKISRHIVRIINSILKPGQIYCEPFVGSGKIIQSVRSDVTRIGSDIDPQIICLLRSVRDGWVPPDFVSEDDWKKWKKRSKTQVHPMCAFCGYACSFGGRYFQGYARSRKTEVNFAISAKKSLIRQRPFLQGCIFKCRDYRSVYSRAHVYYCDVPYKGTIPVGSTKTRFDSDKFWEWAEELSKKSTVLVSEYECPIRAEVVWEKSIAASIRTGTDGHGGSRGDGKRKLEKLFLLSKMKVGLF